MSYIRCLSNPEGLYSWGETKNICFSIGKEFISCRSKTFKKFARYVAKNEFMLTDKTLRMGGLSIRELQVEDKTRPINKKLKLYIKLYGKYQRNYKVRLVINGKKIDMWYVTWYYFFSHYCDSHNIKVNW